MIRIIIGTIIVIIYPSIYVERWLFVLIMTIIGSIIDVIYSSIHVSIYLGGSGNSSWKLKVDALEHRVLFLSIHLSEGKNIKKNKIEDHKRRVLFLLFMYLW